MSGNKYRILACTLAFVFILSAITACKPKTSETASSETSSLAESSESNGSSEDISSDSSITGESSDVISGSGQSSAITSNTGTSSAASSTVGPKVYPNLKGMTIKYYTYMYNEETEKKTWAGRQGIERIAEIEKILNCKVVRGSLDFNTLFQQLIAGDNVCDVVSIGGPHLVPSFMKNNCLAPLDNLGIDFKEAKFDPAVTKAMNYGGKQYGMTGKPGKIPSVNFVMFYNKTLLTKLGITEDLYKTQANGQWTWAKFEALCKQITRDTNNDGVTDIWGTTEGNAMYPLAHQLMASNKGDWIKRTSDNPITYVFTAGSDPNAFEALKFWQKLAYTDKVVDLGLAGETGSFIQGKVGFMANYLNRASIPSMVMGMKDTYGILMMPKGPKASDYISQLQYYGAFGILTNAIKGDDANHTKAKGFAAFIDLLCGSGKPDPKGDTIEELQLESMVRDQGSLNTINQLRAHQVESENQIGWDVISGLNKFDDTSWYAGMGKIAQGEDPASVIQAHINQYNEILKTQWSFAK